MSRKQAPRIRRLRRFHPAQAGFEPDLRHLRTPAASPCTVQVVCRNSFVEHAQTSYNYNMHKTVYTETTIPSFYYEARSEPDMVARTSWTQDWWDQRAVQYDLVTSEAVLEELSVGEYPNKDKTIELPDALPLLRIMEETAEIVKTYIEHRVMPKNPVGDALHLALASQHKCDFLLTWNCHHLANANKFDHIRQVNTLLGLFTPILVTPLELLAKEPYDEA